VAAAVAAAGHCHIMLRLSEVQVPVQDSLTFLVILYQHGFVVLLLTAMKTIHKG
jgi:hypothetical protein